MDRSFRGALLASCLAVSGLATGCTSELTGNKGNFKFSYTADDNVRDFNKPLAVGAKLDLKVEEAGNGRNVEVTGATTDDPGVLKVASFSGHTVVLQGVGSGSAVVEVEGDKADGTHADDSVNMMARVPEVLKVWHNCPVESDLPRYLVGQDIFVPFDMEMKNGMAVIGYGYYPITIEPADGATLKTDTKEQSSFLLKTGSAKTTVTLKSTIDSTQTRFALVAESDIDAAVLDDQEPEAAKLGQKTTYTVVPTTGGNPICQAKVTMTAASTTPDICAARAMDEGDGNPESSLNWVEIEGKAVGKCSFTVSYPKGRGGAGATASFTVDVAQANP